VISSTLFVVSLLAEAAQPVVQTPKPQDKIICKRYLETGSLVKSTKVCHTRREWSRLNDEARKDAEDMQHMTSAPSTQQ